MPLVAPKRIDRFEGKYSFLSNFYASAVEIHGVMFWSAESAFQACKTAKWETFKKFSPLSAIDAKRKGRVISLRQDWDRLRVGFMYHVLKAKFTQSEELRQKLLDTRGKVLIEGNDWHDTFWGVWEGVGYNWLGRLLMLLRKELEAEALNIGLEALEVACLDLKYEHMGYGIANLISLADRELKMMDPDWGDELSDDEEDDF